MDYIIHPANVRTTTEFDAFTVTPDPTICILQYKFSLDTPNSKLLNLLTKEATATNNNIASALAITDTAPIVKIGFAFAGTEHHDLVGIHGLTMGVSLRDFAVFDHFLKIEFKFKLTITSACSTASFGSISSQLKPSFVPMYNDDSRRRINV